MINSWIIDKFGQACGGGNFLFFPKWYEYLSSKSTSTGCVPVISNINDVWLIVAAVVEILLRVAALVAVVFVIWSGFEYLTSESSPDKVAHARSMLISSLAGLVIAILASAVIGFLAGSLS